VPFVDRVHAHRPEIPLRGRDRRMAEQSGQSVNLAAAPDIRHREAMPERVRVNVGTRDPAAAHTVLMSR
jgi:hypothetical protein